MSSLKINLKIPRPSTEQTIKAASHKATKRRITSDDESDDTVSSRGETTLQKPISKKPRLSAVEDVDPQPEPRPYSRPSQLIAAKSRVSAGMTRKPPKKKRIVSGEEDDEEEFVPETEEKPTGMGMKPKLKDLKGKLKPTSSGGATGGKITAKNERILADPLTSTSTLIGKKRARTEEVDVKEKDKNVDVTSVPAAPTASVPASISNAEPPKKKLPPIKKKPKADSAGASTFVSPSPASPSKPTVNPGKAGASDAAKSQPVTAATVKKPAGPVQATRLNPSGTGDFDLRDTNIWESLIGKGTSSSGPRVGIEKRVSTEERRKQLDKMRNEARARRMEQNQHTFDLQAQSQRIALFERKFAAHKIRIPGPNILGAAFKVRPIPRS